MYRSDYYSKHEEILNDYDCGYINLTQMQLRLSHLEMRKQTEGIQDDPEEFYINDYIEYEEMPTLNHTNLGADGMAMLYGLDI